jgi:nicotinate-nucleotide adenylyltransferase
MTKPIGILGGSFDPVHFGHLRLAMECIETAGLERVLFVPLNIPSHRHPLVANATERRKMLSLALVNKPYFDISDVELDRHEVSYTLDTLETLRDEYGTTPLCLIMGMDAFIGFDTWKAWEQIPDYAHIIITNRPNASNQIDNMNLDALLAERLTDENCDLRDSPAGKIRIIEVPLLDISSTRIRSMICEGRPVDYLLPERVIDYITRNRIYLDNEK